MDSEKTRMKEQKELAKWKKLAEKKPIGGYMLLMMAVLSVVRLLDEFVTSAPTSVQSNIVEEFFVKGMGMRFEQGLSVISLISTGLLVFSILAVFFVSLCDKLGRRKILIISTLGMTTGMLICSISANLTMHLIGRAIIAFFVATDVHQIYVMELAPKDRRSMYTQITTVFGSLGVMLVGLVRMLFTHNGVLNWRGVFLLPCAIGIAATAAVILFARETDTFLTARISYLEKPAEQREAELAAAKKRKTAAEAKAGILPAAKYVFTHKQTRSIFLAQIPCCFATMAFATYYETIMTSSGMNTNQVSAALFIYPVSSAIVALLVGYITDHLGRRPAGILTASLSFVSLFLFIFSAKLRLNPYVVGLLLGMEIGAFWRFNETLSLSMRESVPTVIRASAGSVTGLISLVFSVASGILIAVFLAKYPVEQVCLVWGAVTIGLSALLYTLFAKETKNIDLDDIH